jgi:TonB family protein
MYPTSSADWKVTVAAVLMTMLLCPEKMSGQGSKTPSDAPIKLRPDFQTGHCIGGGPYRRNNLFLKLAERWPHSSGPVLVISVLHDGTIERVRLFRSSGNQQLDEDAVKTAVSLKAVQPLPQWFKGYKLEFKIDMSGMH